MSKFFRVDANHDEIKKHLQTVPGQVIDFSKAGEGFPDLMFINKHKQTCLIEVKFGKNARVKRTQLKFIGNYLGFIGFAENESEAESLSLYPENFTLTQKTKDKIAALYLKTSEKEIRWETFKKEIGYQFGVS